MTKRIVFYSWMANMPGRTNRTLIERALRAAAEAITKDTSNDYVVEIDQDARGEAGYADIASALFRKIDRADILVADVSIIDATATARTQNANVMVELGYAAARFGWANVVAVFNEAFGALKSDLPFDLRNRTTIGYTAPEGDAEEHQTERASARTELAKRLEAALRTALLDAEAQVRRFWLREVSSTLFPMIVWLREFEERAEWPRYALAAKKWGDDLRKAARDPVAERCDVRNEMSKMAVACEEFGSALDRKHGFDASLAALRESAGVLKARLFDGSELDDEWRLDIRRHLRQLADECIDLGEQAETFLQTRHPSEVWGKSEHYGFHFLRLLEHDVSFLLKPAEDARRLARVIHLHQNGMQNPIGDLDNDRRRVEEIRAAGKAVRELVS